MAVNSGQGAPAGKPNALAVVYNHPEDSAAFQAYLHDTHIPLVLQVPGIRQIIIHAGMTPMEGGKGTIYQLGTVVFESHEVMQDALQSRPGQIALADVANFATGGFSAHFTHVDLVTIPSNSGLLDVSTSV